MSNFYENNEDEIRSKLNDHQFEMKAGAWEDLDKRLNTVSSPIQNSASNSWGSWVFTGLVSAAALTGILLYAYHAPNFDESAVLSLKKDSLKNTKEIISPVENKSPEKDKNTPANLATANILPPVIHNNNISENYNPPVEYKPIAAAPEIKTAETPSENTDNIVQKKEVRIPKKKIEITYAYKKSRLTSLCNLNPSKISKIDLNVDELEVPIVLLDSRDLKKVKSLQFGIEAGLATNIGNSKLSLAPVAGVFVRKNLNPRQAIQADLQYKILLVSNSPNRNEIPVDMTFNSANSSSHARKNARIQKLTQLHLIELPLSFIQKLNKKHSVYMGVTAAYLCAAGNLHQSVDRHPNSKVIFNKLDLGALSGYTYKIKKNLELTVYCQVGFMNLVNKRAINNPPVAQDAESFSIPEDQLGNIPEGEALVPLEMNEDNQSFFQTPEKFYNTDIRMMLRYLF